MIFLDMGGLLVFGTYKDGSSYNGHGVITAFSTPEARRLFTFLTSFHDTGIG
jgi:hypothetical protein